MGKGGGHGSGTVAYPDYMQTEHGDWLDTMDGLLTPYVDGSTPSPYDGEAAYDPAAALLAMSNKYDATETIINALDAESDWASAVDKANTKTSTLFPDVNTDVTGGATDARTITDSVASDAVDAGVLAEIGNVIDEAVSKSLESTSIDDAIDDAVDNFEQDALAQHFRSMNRWAAGMSEVNAVQSSSFVMGMALLERDFTREVNRYRTSLKLQNATQLTGYYIGVLNSLIALRGGAFGIADRGFIAAYIQNEQAKDIFVTQSAFNMVSALASNSSFSLNLLGQYYDYYRTNIVASKEKIDTNMQLDVLDAKWPFDMMMYGGNMLASISGAASAISNPQSTAQSAVSGGLSGALAGAEIGAKIGAAGGPIGAGTGALIGMGAGILQAFM